MSYKDKESTNLIDQCFAKDVLWSLAGGLPSKDDLPLLGLWASFMKQTGEDVTTKSLLKYLPADESPPESKNANYFREMV